VVVKFVEASYVCKSVQPESVSIPREPSQSVENLWIISFWGNIFESVLQCSAKRILPKSDVFSNFTSSVIARTIKLLVEEANL